MLAMILDLENQHSFDLHHQDGRHLTCKKIKMGSNYFLIYNFVINAHDPDMQ